MPDDPLAPPPGAPSEVLRRFLAHASIQVDPSLDRPPVELLQRVAAAFSRIPYENLTKIIKEAQEGTPERARRWPIEVLRDHLALGAGGTCFSLTGLLLHLVRALGFEAEPILADRHYGPDTHCALVVKIGGEPHLLDPGYLITRPVPLPRRGETRLETPFNQILLKPLAGGDRVELATVSRGAQGCGGPGGNGRSAAATPSIRLTYRSEPVDRTRFLKAWDASFAWDMMRYPLLTRIAGESQVYLQGRRLQVRSRAGVERSELSLDDLPGRIAAEFSIEPGVAERAIAALRRRGELLG